MKFFNLLSVVFIANFFFLHSAAADIYVDATQAPTSVVGAKYFGVHFHRIVVLPNEKAVPTQWPPFQFGSMRLWDTVTRWGDIAPSAGVWSFARMDVFVDTAVKNNSEVLYTLGSTPKWASARPDEKCSYGFGCGAESVRIAHWQEYVRRVALRYGNHIQDYELWNEPNFSDFERDVGRPGFFTGRVEQMVSMAKSARKILDEVSPNAKLCTPGFVNGPDRLEKFLADGGAQYVQAVCYHFYSEGTDHFAKQLIEVRAIMKRQGVDNLPLWNTETAVDTLLPTDPPSGISARNREEATARLNQLLILGAAGGIERFYYYAWDNSRSGMVTSDGRKLFGYQAMQQVHEWLIGVKFLGCKSNGSLVSCLAEKGEKQLLFVWATKPTEANIPQLAVNRVANAQRLIGGQFTLSSSVLSGKTKMTFDLMPVRFELEGTAVKLTGEAKL